MDGLYAKEKHTDIQTVILGCMVRNGLMYALPMKFYVLILGDIGYELNFVTYEHGLITIHYR